MGCPDYMTVAELKSLVNTGDKTDAALAILLWAGFDWIDNYIISHSLNRAIRLYHDEGNSAATCTVAVSATEVTIVITGGAAAGTHSFEFATYDVLGKLVDAINMAGLNVTASLLTGDWLPSQPSTNLSGRNATSIFGIDSWAVLCLDQLTVTLNGEPTPHLFLPLEPYSVSAVTEDGTALTFGTHYWVRREGYLIRRYYDGGPGCSDGLRYQTCLWSAATPENICVSFTPACWLRIPLPLIKLALAEFIKLYLASTGFKSETIGKYQYDLGSGSGAAGSGPAYAYLNTALKGLTNMGRVMMQYV